MTSRRSLMLLCLVLVIGIVGPIRQAAASPDVATATASANDCSFLIQGADDPRPRLGEISCGTLDVPENWSKPDGRRIQISYVVLKATGANPAPDPMIYLAGGPGSTPLTHIEAWAGVFTGLREERDVVMFDQRGTRLSSPLRCEEYSLALAVDIPPDVLEAAGGPPATTPDVAVNLDAEALLQAARAYYGPIAAACAAQITATGVDLTQYNTISSATDTVALVKALGYDDYNLYGLSYGTRLALEVMRSYPDSGIRSVVLDSTYPPEIKSYEEFPEEPHQVVIQLFADCERDPACQQAYPNLKERFIALLAQLHTQPIVSAEGTTVTDRDVIAVMQSLGGMIPAVPYIPLMISELEQGVTTTYEGITSGSIFAAPPSATPEAAMDATPEPAAAGTLSPARRFVLELQARTSTEPGDPTGAFGQLLVELDAHPHTAQSLRDFVNQVLPGSEQAEARASLLAAIDAMSEADLQEVFAVVEQTITLDDVRMAGGSPAQFYSVECNERIPFQSFAVMVTNAQNLEIPELALGIPESFVKVFAICEQWPSGQADASSEQPVWSDIPTLIMAGAYDSLTPVTWNKSAFTTLPNGDFVLSPMAGHGVIIYSTCASDIAVAFMTNPANTPDSSCLASLKPAWVLPG